MEPRDNRDREEKSSFPAAFAVGAIVVLLLVAGAVLLSRTTRPRGSAGAENLPFGPAEQAYAGHIQFQSIQMSRATNFLNQEFTYVSGTVSNDGLRTVRGLEVTLEFYDPFHQVVLRETDRLIAPGSGNLNASQRRNFQITFEHVPAEWNQQYPAIRVTGLVLE